mgnify:CR=1 FL=1
MKKTLLITLVVLITSVCFGQSNGALKFLGIPIDGTETQFATKLKSKGFAYNSLYESYKGQFNGKPVDVYIHTNHNLVDRVYVAFPATSEENIRIEYNRLLDQLEKNSKYLDLAYNVEIPENDDISYEISFNNKRYQASFSYFNPDRDPISFMNALFDKFSDFFTKEQLASLKEYAEKAISLPENQRKAMLEQMMSDTQSMGLGPTENSELDSERQIRFLATFMDGMRELADGEVWFMIHEHYGQYQIGLYYDNLHNQANGEDL